jgi:citrate synthase
VKRAPEFLPEFLDAKSAARFLGVKLDTLYSYASRGLLRSEPRLDGRGRQYAREDLERLKSRHDARSGHAPVAASALRFGEPVLETAISGIGPGGPIYRGIPAVDLAREGRSFEAVSEFLWSGALPPSVEWETETAVGLLRGLRVRAASGVSPLVVLLGQVAELAAMDSSARTAEAASLEDEWPRARALVRVMAALAGGRAGADAVKAASVPRVAGVLAAALGVPPSAAGALDFALVVTADHELNASAFAARVIASTGAGLYASVAGALAALTGPKHGGATERVEAFLDGMQGDAARAVTECAARGDAVPGFGHAMYPDGDPRATALLEVATRMAGTSVAFARCLAVKDAVDGDGRGHPNLDFALVTLSRALGLPRGGAASLFAVGRTAGWVAHALEQRAADYLLRPRAAYVGPGAPLPR